MIQEFVNRYMTKQTELKFLLRKKHPENYGELVKIVIEIITSEYEDFCPDPERITEIDHGDYQGTLLYVIGEKGYQPSIYYSVMVDYGSCSGCDTLQAISGYSNEPPTDEQVKDYMTLCLHIVQKLKEINKND